MRSEDILHLANEKYSFQWELACTRQVRLADVPLDTLRQFAENIRKSERVSQHIKQMSDREIAENYGLLEGEYLTCLGMLWLGNASQRSRLAYPITVQYIVYDKLEQKIREIDWHDNLLNPAESLLDIERQATELKYFYEFPDGLFGK